MELRDLIVTPLLIILVLAVAYFLRPVATDSVTRKYYFPALIAKMIGAILIGLIYQFYYHGGDTFTYHTHGSRPIWEAIMDSPAEGFRILFSNGTYGKGLWKISDAVWQWRDDHSFFVVRIATFFDLLTFSTYSATAILFAVFGFAGGWLLFLTFYYRSPGHARLLAWSCLFIPSVIFWGSGILKDTVTLTCIGISTFAFDRLFLKKQYKAIYVVLLLISLYFIYSIRPFILQAFVPSLILWLFSNRLQGIRSFALRILMIPFALLLLLSSAYFFVTKISEGDRRYAIDRLAETARITAYDIRFYTGKDAGSGYSLGELDGTLTNMLTRLPQAINVSLFRPYPWEVHNLLIAFSSLESTAFLFLTLYCLFRYFPQVSRSWSSPDVLFCFSFSLIFAFVVGISTYNFGSLARYKIPLLPFYLIGLTLLTPSRNENELTDPVSNA
ncbi:MAG: hypothetical protein JSS79_08860 [Bacteroidetes bacterium]|nr:hypothetical protein [Bacteroidota bacterium]